MDRLAWILLPALLLAQQPPARPGVQSQVQPATSNATFSTSTQLVVELVTVKDKSGKAIEGLHKEDFTVLEDGKPQTIRFFEFENVEEAAAAAPVPAPLPPPSVLPELTQTEIAPERPGSVRYRDRRLLALYFDMKSMPVLDQLRALDAAQKFVRTDMSPADLVALMEYDGSAVEVLQDFTGDRERLQTVLATLIAGEADNTGDSPPGAAASDNGAAFGQDDSEFNIFTTDRKLAALETAAQMLSRLNEKKALIYFASGLRLNGLDNQAQLRATINHAIRAGVSIWSIDARGLVALPPVGDATQGSQGNAGMYTGAAATAVLTNFQQSQDTLYTLAADTGGKALLDYNDLAAGIVAAEKSIASHYIIGYYSSNDAADGKLRRIKIALNNGVQASLDFRQSYYAPKVFARFTAADKERQLEDALMLEDPVTELTIALEVNYFRLNNAEYFTPIMVKIPGSELALARKRGAEHTLIDFIGEIKDGHGTTVRNLRDYMDIKLSGATVAEWARRPIEYDTGYTLLPGAYQIKVLARDAETGRIGTYLNKFYIPNLNREQQRVPISSVVLSSQRASLKDALATAGKPSKAAATQAANPLVRDGVKLIPSVTRVFHASGEMYVYLQAYEPAAAVTQPLIAYVTFFQGPVKAMTSPLVKVTGGLDAKSHMLPLRLNFSLGALKPGEYDCEVTVLDPTGQKAAFWEAPVMIIP